MHISPCGIHYTIEVDDNSAVLVLFDHLGVEVERLDGFKSIRAMLNYVNDLANWEKRKSL